MAAAKQARRQGAATPRSMGGGLDCLPLIDEETGDITVVVETPKDSKNKYKYDPECGAIRLKAVLGEGLAFPFDFGFFPSTVGDDGDPLDVLLFLDHAVPPGSIASARLLGVLEARQRTGDKPWIRNDRFIAVATHAHTHSRLEHISDLRSHLLEEVESFFVHYAGLDGKRVEFLARRGPRHALRLLKAGRKAFRKKRAKK